MAWLRRREGDGVEGREWGEMEGKEKEGLEGMEGRREDLRRRGGGEGERGRSRRREGGEGERGGGAGEEGERRGRRPGLEWRGGKEREEEVKGKSREERERGRRRRGRRGTKEREAAGQVKGRWGRKGARRKTQSAYLFWLDYSSKKTNKKSEQLASFSRAKSLASGAAEPVPSSRSCDTHRPGLRMAGKLITVLYLSCYKYVCLHIHTDTYKHTNTHANT